MVDCIEYRATMPLRITLKNPLLLVIFISRIRHSRHGLQARDRELLSRVNIVYMLTVYCLL